MANDAQMPDVRRWDYYPIEMPLTADGKGPATVGVDAARIAYEVWDRDLSSHATYDNLPDAINEAMRLNAALPSDPAAALCASGQVRALVDQAASIFTHCSVTDGVCCCGDNMEGHSHPMSAGHGPVDHGSYMADKWLDSYAALTPAPTAQDAVPVAARWGFDGYGWTHYLDNGSGSDWLKRATQHDDVDLLYAHPPQPRVAVAGAGDDLVRAMRLFWEADEAADECRASGRDLEAARYDKMATSRWQSIPEKIDALDAALRALKGEQ